jgi:hypothetical protein
MLKKIVIGFSLLVLIAIVLGCGRYSPLRPFKDRAAQKDVNEKHAAADIEGDQLFRLRISRLRQLGILGEKVAESKADTCYINSVAAGFTTVSWEQFCQLDYLAGYTALLSREETFTRLETASLHKEDPMFRRGSVNRRGCGYDTGAFNNISYVPAGSIPEDDLCRIPDPVNGITPRGARMPGSTKFNYTFDPDAIDQSVDLLWITYSHRYYYEDLGCRPGLYFCGLTPPRSTPIQAD